MRQRTIIILLFTILVASSVSAQIPKDWKYRAALLSSLQSPSDSIYIQDRKTLDRIADPYCGDSSIIFVDSASKAGSIVLAVFTKSIAPVNQPISFSNGNGSVRQTEVDNIAINWDGTIFKIPESAYAGLFNPSLSQKKSKGLITYIEPYTTPDHKFLYLYIRCRDQQGSYGAKLIFDRTQYLTRIISEHQCDAPFDYLDAKGDCMQ